LNFCPNCLPYTSADIYSNRPFQGYEKKTSQYRLAIYLLSFLSVLSIGVWLHFLWGNFLFRNFPQRK
jgi:hypothetical protein